MRNSNAATVEFRRFWITLVSCWSSRRSLIPPRFGPRLRVPRGYHQSTGLVPGVLKLWKNADSDIPILQQAKA